MKIRRALSIEILFFLIDLFFYFNIYLFKFFKSKILFSLVHD